MKLAMRLSAFFLAVQFLTLAGFSAALYLLAADHLSRQVDERMDASLTALSAAAEIEPEGVTWEPNEREQGLGRDAGPDQIHWVVLNALGTPIDFSVNLRRWRAFPDLRPDEVAVRFHGPDGRHWRGRSRRLHAARPEDEGNGAPTTGSPSGPGMDRGKSALTLAVFAPLGPTEAILRRLAWTLSLLSLTLWLGAILIGRWLCRRALAPLSTMAEAATDADADSPDVRLPLPGTGDELETLGRAFNGLLDRLHEALDRQRRFTGDASHQLRTPLTGLLSHVDVALRRERPAAEYERVLGVVRNKAVHLRQIIESLLFLARTESESVLPDLDRVDLAAWIPEHLRGWSSQARAADIRTELTGGVRLDVRAHLPAALPVAGQPAGKRLRLQRRGDAHRHLGASRSRGHDPGRTGPRPRALGRRPVADLPALLPDLTGPATRPGRSGPRPFSRPTNRGRVWRVDRGGERAGQGQQVRRGVPRGEPAGRTRVIAGSRLCARRVQGRILTV